MQAQSITVLDNGQLRAGNGSQNSINGSGNLEQLFYHNGVQNIWRQLTFGSYPLDNAIAVGGAKANEWNINGTIIENPVLSNQVIDKSGYVATSSNKGYGKIISKGTIQIANATLEVENTYTLPQNSAFVEVKVKIKNIGSGLAENVRLWMGTRDDYVGGNDAPIKQRGNLVNGAFVGITNPATKAAAIKISTGDEGVIFYTNSTRANTVINGCCGFRNVINQDPQTSVVYVPDYQNYDFENGYDGNYYFDGSYGFYVRMNDLPAGASDEFSWYYAAGELANLNAIISDVAQVSGSISDITSSQAKFKATSSVAATGYWLVTPRNAQAPTAAQIKAGTNYGNVVITARGSGNMPANVETVFNLTGLNAATNYDFHFVSEDGTPQFSDVYRTQFATKALPTISSINPVSVCQNTTSAAIPFTIGDAETAATALTVTVSSSNPNLIPAANVILGGAGANRTLTLSPAAGQYGSATLTITVTDADGDSKSTNLAVTVTLNDVAAPVVTNITYSQNASATSLAAQATGTNLLWYTTATGGTGSATAPTPNTTQFGVQEYWVSQTVSGCTSARAKITVTIADKIAPTVRVKNISVSLDAAGQVTITAANVDNGSSDASGIQSLALSNTTFNCSNVGENEVTLTVTDIYNNVATATATVTVQDKIAPVASAKNITVALDATGQVTITAADINNGSTDVCGIAAIALSKTAFDCSNVGANTVTLTVTDNHGNISTATATVTVEDKITPVAQAKNITVSLNAAGQVSITAADVNNGSADVCGLASIVLSKTTFNCSNIGENEVTLTVTDKSGNTATATAIVTVQDKVAPAAIAKNIKVALNAAGQATITAADVNNGSTDACGIASIALSKTTFDCSNVGANTVTLTVTDNHGNISTATATVTVEDKVAPVAIAKNITVALDAAGQAIITAADVNNGSSDICGLATIVLSKTTFNCTNTGDNTVTLTVTDKHNNVSTTTAIVTVEDNIAPSLVAPVAVTVNVDADKNTAANVILGTPVTADNCAVTSVTNNAPAEFLTGTTTVTWTATDAAGNSTTATQTVTVRRNIISVASLTKVNVPIRTAFAQLNSKLPATAEVTYSDNSKEIIPVTWATGSYNGIVANNYELIGTLTVAAETTNLRNLEANVTVTVEPNKVPTSLAISKNTFSPNITPEEAVGTFNTTDPDDTEFVYTLVTGAGDADNNLFEIKEDKLFLKSHKGLSGKTQFTVRVRTTDPYFNILEKEFKLTKSAYAKAPTELKIVNAFTPNGDGVNDEWSVPELKFYNKVSIEVFDQSGVRLFHTTNPEKGWDGKNKYGQVLQGAFLFVIQVEDIKLTKKGVVTVLKK
ncbi:MAG: gliding motility-associated C-terminal domain-containing protein [Adhaeribacter sp.]